MAGVKKKAATGLDAQRSGYYRTSPKDAAARTKRIAESPAGRAAERKKIDQEAFRISEERRKAREEKPKPPPPKPKTGMQKFKESFTKMIGLGGILKALEPRQSSHQKKKQ